MSDTTSASATGDRISLGKGSANAAPPRRPGLFGRPPAANAAPVENVPAPLTIKLVVVALLTVVVCNIVIALLWRLPGYVNQLTGVLAKSNSDSSKPKEFYDSLAGLHAARTSLMITAGVIGLAFVLLAWALLRTRSASGSRWALLIIIVFTGTYGSVIPGKGLPVPIQVVGVIVGVCAILALLLTFVPPASQKYFRACKLASTPEHLRGQARPGLGSLFGQKRPRGAAAETAAPAPRAAATRSTSGKARAKVRSDTDAVARGAELARSRAKAASKSRRTAE